MPTKRGVKAKADTRRTGKYTGYEQNAEGDIAVAPCYADEMSALSDEIGAINAIVKSTNEMLIGMRVRIERSRRQWWARVAEDLGLSLKDDYVYANGVISKKPKVDPVGSA